MASTRLKIRDVVTRSVASALLALALVPVGAAQGSGADVRLWSSGSPFDANGDGWRDRVEITLGVGSNADADVAIYDFDGRRIKTLAKGLDVDSERSWIWAGRDGSGDRVPFGPYRVRATVRQGGNTLKRAIWVTRARRVPYPARPGAITIAIDPGHGGPAAGAVWKGRKEDAINLDISLRLEAMLKSAGLNVVMTRRTDRNVSPAGKDLNFDGRYTRLDELIARNDVGNQARADIHLALHNNASSCHCTRGSEMYTHFRRSWSAEGRKLAKFMLDEHIVQLGRIDGYRPKRRGVFSHPFKALKPYHKRAMPRPSLQPSVLGESLFLDWPSEHRILGRRSGRQAIAAAYFDGMARYLAWRPFGVQYIVRSKPAGRVIGTRFTHLGVDIVNSGNRDSAGWRLVARVVPKVARYDGRPRRGTIVAQVAVPDGLAPGQVYRVDFDKIPLPDKAGSWLLKLDIKLPGGDAMSKHGVVGPQSRVVTTAR